MVMLMRLLKKMEKKEKEFKIIRVIWNDITFFNEREEIRNLDKYKLIEIETIGYLIREDKNKIILAMSLIPMKDEILDFYLIPKSNIVKIEIIKNVR